MINRRNFLASSASILASLASAPVFLSSFAYAQSSARLRITVRPGQQFSPIPIAIPGFAGDRELSAEIARIISSNLKTCGYFQPLYASQMPTKVIGADVTPNFPAWLSSGAQALVAVSAHRNGGQVIGKMRLWDVALGQTLIGQEFHTSDTNARRLGHILADLVYIALTGGKGMFDSKIAYIDESGPKNRRIKKLAIADWDGTNTRYYTSGNELILSPQFDSAGLRIAYIALASQIPPKVYILNIASGTRRTVGDYANMTYAPRFSPDGQRILFSLQEKSAAHIYSMELSTGRLAPMTSGVAIDTSPSFSPDGSNIVFESDRSGTQQLYVMDAYGKNPTRISFGSGRYATPVWSPDTENPLIAFTKQSQGRFSIGIMKPDGSGEHIIADGYHNEGPTWAPNGRHVMYFRDTSDAGGPRLAIADITGHAMSEIRTPAFASDPCWSGMLK